MRLAITTAAASSLQRDTSTRAPSRKQPPPRVAQIVTSCTGFAITPTTGSPRSHRAIETPNSGMRWRNSLVPSIGSTIQARGLRVRAGSLAVSSESSASRGKAARSRRAMARSDARSATVTGLSSDFSQLLASVLVVVAQDGRRPRGPLRGPPRARARTTCGPSILARVQAQDVELGYFAHPDAGPLREPRADPRRLGALGARARSRAPLRARGLRRARPRSLSRQGRVRDHETPASGCAPSPIPRCCATSRPGSTSWRWPSRRGRAAPAWWASAWAACTRCSRRASAAGSPRACLSTDCSPTSTASCTRPKGSTPGSSPCSRSTRRRTCTARCWPASATRTSSFRWRTSSELRGRLAEADAPSEVVIYPGAGHAFMNDTRPAAFRPEIARQAWARTLAFLREQLL